MSEILMHLRSFKILDFAIFDFVVSFGSAILIANNYNLNINKVMYSVIPISVIIHVLFKQYTPLTKKIIDPGNIIYKIIFIMLIYLSIQ